MYVHTHTYTHTSEDKVHWSEGMHMFLFSKQPHVTARVRALDGRSVFLDGDYFLHLFDGGIVRHSVSLR